MNPYWLLVIPAVLALWWMEWGKVKCRECDDGGVREIVYVEGLPVAEEWHDCPVCHGTGRVRRRWIIKLWRK
jgi:hypothetical protein